MPFKKGNILSLKSLKYYITSNGCWVCTSHCKTSGGYPHFHRNGKLVQIHRYMYEKYKESIPGRMLVLHSCDNRQCINPDHLRVGTYKDNTKDMDSRNRRNSKYKLTFEQVKEIRQSALLCTILAKIYNVSITHIWCIKNNKRRRNK